MVDAAYSPELDDRPVERPAWIGYALVWAAVAVWSVNAAVSKVVLESAGLTAYELSEVRTTGGALLLFGALALLAPGSLRVALRELPFLAVFGVAGLVGGQLFYVLSIQRLEIGVALVVIYVSPVLVALWARFARHEPVRRRIWVSIGVSLVGLTLVVDLWGGLAVDGLGLVWALVTALAFAVYVVMADHGLEGGRAPYALLAWGLFFGSVFWAVVQPWWNFPGGMLGESATLLGRLDEFSAPVWLLVGYVVVLGTVVPFGLIIAALNYIPATRVSIVAMLEPVGAALVAYGWLREALTPVQLVGALLVLGGVGLAQTARAAPVRRR